MIKNKLLTDQKLMDRIAQDKKVRAAISRENHLWFFNIYFPHYSFYPPALFHREMFELTQRDDLRLLTIMAFRGSGKSTIMNLSYALWSVLGKFQKKFLVIASQTQNQAEGHFSSIINELKNNDRLRADLGPFEVGQDPYSVLLKNFNAKIMFIYNGQSIRGMRHGQHRIGLIILDDIEDSWSIQFERNRNATYKWFETEVMPAGDSSTTIVILGNLLDEDSFIMRIRENIKSGKMPGIFRAYPLLDDLDQILWPEKFTKEDVEQLKKSIVDETVWEKEYLLKIYKEITCIGELLDESGQNPADKKNSRSKTAVHLGKYVISAPTIELSNRELARILSKFN
jgi:hypothetical protein